MLPFADYSEGRLPPFCVISGEPSDQLIVMRTRINHEPTGRGTGPPWLKALDVAALNLSAGRSQDLLLGRLPVSGRHIKGLERRRRLGLLFQVGGVVGMIWAAAAGVVLSGMLVVVSLIVFVWGGRLKKRVKAKMPVPTAIHAGSQVVVDNVHPTFASAVGG